MRRPARSRNRSVPDRFARGEYATCGLDPLEARVHLAATAAPATYLGTSGSDSIRIYVSGADMVVVINGTSNVTPIAETDSIIIHAGGQDDLIRLESAQVPLTIYGEGGDDELIVTDPSGDMANVAAGVLYDGGAGGDDTITIWDDLRPASAGSTYVFTSDSLTRDGTVTFNFVNIEDLDFRGGASDDTLIVEVAPAGIPNYDVYGGAGDDVFELAPAAGDLSVLLSPVEVHGELGTDSIVLHDTANATGGDWTVTNLTAGRTNWAGFRYNTSESVTVHAGSGADTFAIESTRDATSVTINAGGGDDAFNLTPTSQLLEDLLSPLTLNGEAGVDQLALFDGANTFPDTYAITDSNISRTFFDFGATYANVEGIALHAGNSGQKTFLVESTASGAPVTINAGGTGNVLRVNADGVGLAEVVIAQVTNLNELTIGDGGVVRLVTGAGATVITQALSIGAAGKLDIMDNAVIVDYAGASPLNAIRSAIASGHGGGAWNGDGIASSSAASDPSHYAVGFAEASAIFSTFPAVFANQNVDDTAVVLRYARVGDSNLDGQVNLSDFNRLAASFGSASLLWSDGNFNYDSLVNLADFNLLAGNFGQSAGAAQATVAQPRRRGDSARG